MSERRVPFTNSDRGVILGVWVMLGLLESAKALLVQRPGSQPLDWITVLLANMPWWLMWAAFCPLVIGFARRVRVDQARQLRLAAAHLMAAVAFSLLHHAVVGTLYFYTVTRGVTIPYGGEYVLMTLPLQIRAFFTGYFMLNLLTYFAIVAAYYGLEYYRRHHQSELRSARLEANVHQARLAALRMELNPHFLFNTLNAIAGLVRDDQNAGAIRMLARLSTLLRATLEHGSDQQVPLELELELLRTYLEIEQVRFGDRLEVSVTSDDAARATLVPPLLLQPLVENAVKHGVACHSGHSRVEVVAEVAGEVLVLSVTNTGEGSNARPSPAVHNGSGIGLTNTRKRLMEMYGSAATLTLDVLDAGEACATIRIPVHSREAVVAGFPDRI